MRRGREEAEIVSRHATRSPRGPCRWRSGKSSPFHAAALIGVNLVGAMLSKEVDWARCRPGIWTRTLGSTGRPIECAHVRRNTDGGTGLKPSDRWAISLCRAHHIEQHRIGEPAFEKRYAIDLRELAIEFARRSPHWRRVQDIKLIKRLRNSLPVAIAFW